TTTNIPSTSGIHSTRPSTTTTNIPTTDTDFKTTTIVLAVVTGTFTIAAALKVALHVYKSGCPRCNDECLATVLKVIRPKVNINIDFTEDAERKGKKVTRDITNLEDKIQDVFEIIEEIF
ncbi:unnamed protein product, partial [Lymnaea stagnalis]